MIEAVLFDLDGTLVHSSPGVLESFRRTFITAGVAAVDTIDERVIGPPLRSTLERLTGLTNPARIDHLAAVFREVYDTEGAMAADPYPGLDDVLDALAATGSRAFIVTNKRIHPARLIADRLGLTARLAGVYALDSYTPAAARKQVVIARVLAEHRLDATATVMVGDSVEDGEAAEANGVAFIAATYGYGSPLNAPRPAAVIGELADLPAALMRLNAARAQTASHDAIRPDGVRPGDAPTHPRRLP